MTPIGRLRKKIACQEKYVVRKPPTIGPTVGPIIAGIVIQFIAETSPERGKLRNRIRRPTGVILTPPNPCPTRITTIIGRLVDKPNSAEPPAKIAIARQNTHPPPTPSPDPPPTES